MGGLLCGKCRICLKCLEKEPTRRYPSAEAVAEDLERWLRGEPIQARPLGLLEGAARWLRRNARAAAFTLALGLAWGVSVGVGVIAELDLADQLLVPQDAGLLNPVALSDLAARVPVVRRVSLGIAAILTLTIGWWLRWAVGPKTTAAAFGWAAVLGLITTLATFLFVGPPFVVAHFVSPFAKPLHPIEDPWRIDPPRAGTSKVTPEQERYLRQFLSQSKPPRVARPPAGAPAGNGNLAHGGWASRDLQMGALLSRAQMTNLLHTAWVSIGVGLLCVIVMILAVVCLSSLAVDYLIRSGRSRWACAGGYLELTLGVAVPIAVLFMALYPAMQAAVEGRPYRLGPFWAIVGLTTILVYTVIRGAIVGRWHPAIRIGLYVLWGVVMLSTMRLVGGNN